MIYSNLKIAEILTAMAAVIVHLLFMLENPNTLYWVTSVVLHIHPQSDDFILFLLHLHQLCKGFLSGRHLISPNLAHISCRVYQRVFLLTVKLTNL